MRLGIIGTGMIGASIGLRSRAEGARVLGYDASDEALETAMERGAVDERTSRDEIYARCEHIVIAIPPRATCAELRSLARRAADWQLLLDVASVKRSIMKASADVAKFAGTHPLAGNEGSGPEAASAELFDGRTWALVPSGDTSLDERARGFVSGLGATPIAVDAELHDAAVALTSHLPQMIAWLLSGKIREGGPLYEALCGPAGREILRLGRSRPDLWREILAENADNVGAAGTAIAGELIAACNGVDAGNGP